MHGGKKNHQQTNTKPPKQNQNKQKRGSKFARELSIARCGCSHTQGEGATYRSGDPALTLGRQGTRLADERWLGLGKDCTRNPATPLLKR